MTSTDPNKSYVGVYCLLASLRPFNQAEDEEKDRFLSGWMILQRFFRTFSQVYLSLPGLGPQLPGTAHVQRSHLLVIEMVLK